MDLGTGIAIFSGCSVIVAGILKLVPKKKCDGVFITTREFTIWQKGLDQRFNSIEGWIEGIQDNVTLLLDRK